jgi:hypothetical protein
MLPDTDTCLDLLKSLGVEIEREVWNQVHQVAPPPPNPTLLPSRPHHYDQEMPVFTRSQMDWCDPEIYGYQRYEVVEDEAAAHPLALEWEDEQYYAGNHRPVHRYDRPYRIRWSLSHVVGHVGRVPKKVMQWLRDELKKSQHVITTRAAHEWVRSRLKQKGLRDLYLSTPFIVRQLGGPRWRVTTQQWQRVDEEAIYLHHLFETLKRSGLCVRQRFPKIQYVLLRLLDRHGVLAPYRVPWARTSIKRRQLAQFLHTLECPTSPSADSRSRSVSPGPTPEPATCASEHAPAQVQSPRPVRPHKPDRTQILYEFKVPTHPPAALSRTTRSAAERARPAPVGRIFSHFCPRVLRRSA